MKIVDMSENIRSVLRNSGISNEMRSLESCDWIAYEEYDGRIVGVAGIGGSFHVSGIQISNDFQGKGLGKLLQGTIIKEAKRRNYSFITVFNDPRNIPSEKLHNSFGYKTVFRVHYSSEIVNDVKILVFKPQGKIVEKFLSIFNTRLGTFLLGCLLKTTKSLFPKVILYSEDMIPDPSIRCMLKNFEKI